MSSETEDQCSVAQTKQDDDTQDMHKIPKILYTRDFILSLAELDKCKKLPDGLDKSAIPEFNDCSTGFWKSCGDSDSGGMFSTPYQRFRQNHEHGLLGSGAFMKTRKSLPVPSASAGMILDDHQPLPTKRPEPYRPPHLCKAKPQSRTAINESNNHETFGSQKNFSQEGAEEEKKRKESFELLRMEQQKATQEKQQKTCDEDKENFDRSIPIGIEYSGKIELIPNNYTKSEVSSATPPLLSVFEANSITEHTSASGRLLPSDISSLEENLGTKLLAQSLLCDAKAIATKTPYLNASYPFHQTVEGEEKKIGHAISYERVTIENKLLASRTNELAHKPKKSTSIASVDEIPELYCFNNVPNFTQDVLTCKGFKESKQPKLEELYPAEGLSGKSYCISATEKMQPNSPGNFDEYEHIISVLRMSGVLDLEESPESIELQNELQAVRNDCGLLRVPIKGTLTYFGDERSCDTKLSYDGSSAGKAKTFYDICLPNEEDLIIMDDTICLEDSMFLAAGKRSTSSVNTAGVDRLRSFDQPYLENLTSLHKSQNIMGLETTNRNLILQQSYGQTNLRSPVSHHSYLQRTQINPKTKSFNRETNLCKPSIIHNSPTNVPFSPFQHSHPSMQNLSVSISNCFSPRESYGTPPRGAFQDDPFHQLDYFAPNYHQQYSGGLELPTSCRPNPVHKYN